MLLEDERFWLEQLFQRPDIMYITPAKNQQKYLRKVNGESLYAKTCYLLRNFNDLLQILNDNKIISSNGFVDKFLKKNSFRQMHEFIKGHPKFVYNKDIPQSGCLCAIMRKCGLYRKSYGQRL